MVSYVVDAVIAVTVMHVLLFIFVCVCCENVKVRGCRQCWCGVRVRCGCGECVYGWYMCLSSVGDVLEMSVVRGVGGVRDMCMCLARGGFGGG